MFFISLSLIHFCIFSSFIASFITTSSDASFSKSFSQIASILNLPQASEKEKSLLIAAVRSWFEGHQDCLLIFDNAEDVKSLQPYLPRTDSGQIIITTRAVAMAGVAKSVELDKMEPEAAVEFLLKRAGIVKPDKSQKDAAKEICTLLGHLPLAIDHAGAYIENILDARLSVTQSASSWMGKRVGELRLKLQESEAGLQAYREQEKLIGAVGVQALPTLRINDLSARL
ncbi:MAG: hypothetical protein IH930_07235, partial [Proteobacteria bacterium]|nr:hypothetical protein [Pseudomonadota bacterium]